MFCIRAKETYIRPMRTGDENKKKFWAMRGMAFACLVAPCLGATAVSSEAAVAAEDAVPAPIPPVPAAALRAGAVAAFDAANGRTADLAASYDYALPENLAFVLSPPEIRLKTDARAWGANPRGGKVKEKPVVFLRTLSADGRLLYWQTGILSIDVSALKGGNRDLTQAADIKLVLPALSMNAKLTASAGKNADSPDLWQKQTAEVEMQVSGVPKTNVTLNGADEFSLTYRDPASIGERGGAQHLMQAEKRSAVLSAAVSPLENTSVTVGASGFSQLSKDTTAPNSANKTITTVETQSEKAFVTASWQPLPWIGFEATAREHNTGILWRSMETKSGIYRLSEKQAAMTLKFDGTEIRTSVERAATDYNADAFVAYARSASVTETVPVEPDHGWQFQTEVQQQLGDARLSAIYKAVRDGTVTEFGFSGRGVQAPVSTVLHDRDEVGVAVNMPLSRIGLEGTAMSGDATWRDSHVLDPLTGQYRRASGEVPSKVSLRLEQKLPGQKFRFGVTGELVGGQTAYQTNEISQIESSQKLGAFLAIQPGAYEVDLDVDGLIGTPETVNYLYDGSRTVHQIPKVQVVPAPGPTVRLSLKKAF
jgi:hypothetical protein